MVLTCHHFRAVTHRLCGVMAAALIIVVAVGAARPARAETITVGLFHGTSAGGPIYIAMDKGYFAAEGLTVKVQFFNAGEPIAVATVSGDVDFGAAGISAGLYNLAGQGALKIIGGVNRDVPGFHAIGYYASNRAYEAGLRSIKDFAGHSAGVTTIGSTYHYTLGLLEQHGHVATKSVRYIPLHGMPNIATALTGGKIDVTILPVPFAAPALKRGDFKQLGYTSDVAPWQVGVLWTATKTAKNKPDLVKRFYRAYRKGGHDYNAAFTGPNGERIDGPTAPAVLAIIAKYTHQSVAQIDRGISYVDPDGKLDVANVESQVRWFKSQGMVKPKVDAKALIDRRYAVDIARH
jgi:NitT/TauT family transport system substrate-binding protein